MQSAETLYETIDQNCGQKRRFNYEITKKNAVACNSPPKKMKLNQIFKQLNQILQ